ncbi:MAG TPA: DMT family transporter [Stellaceae bacterium]|nr:DMT family transporter [Stellaceae bacterium]
MSASPQRQWDYNLLLGVLFICLAGLTSPLMNGFAKLLGENYSSLQVSWARAFGHIVFMLGVFVPRFGWRMLRTRRLGKHLARSSCLFISNLAYFFAIGFIPIGKAASINMIGPLLVAMLAWPMLRERTTPGRVAAVFVGFLGVLVIIRPGFEVFHWAALIIVFSAFMNGLYQIFTREVADTEAAETSAIYSSVVGAFGMLLVLPFVWRTPLGFGDLALFCSLGVLGAISHYFIALSLRFAPANNVTPFQYVQMLGSVLVGFLLFGDLPDALTWLGAGIVIACGLYIGWTQTRRPRRDERYTPALARQSD